MRGAYLGAVEKKLSERIDLRIPQNGKYGYSPVIQRDKAEDYCFSAKLRRNDVFVKKNTRYLLKIM